VAVCGDALVLARDRLTTPRELFRCGLDGSGLQQLCVLSLLLIRGRF
jgi:hypothetical protein